MKKCVYLAVLAAFVLLTVHLVRETRRLRSQVQQLEEERVRAAHAKFVSAWVDITDDEREGMVNIYRSIAQAYTNHDIMAMRIAMAKEAWARVRPRRRPRDPRRLQAAGTWRGGPCLWYNST